jgi:hypothetical protein
MPDEPKCPNCGVRIADPTAGCDTCNPHIIEAARQKILVCIPHFRHAMMLAALKGTPEIGFMATDEKGVTSLVCRFEAKEFIEDLAAAVRAGPGTEDDEMEAQAQELVDLVRAAGGTIVSSPVK